MALTLGDNFSYQGAKPLDARLKYDTVAAMKAVADSTMYEGCIAYCSGTDKTYQWKSGNTVDETTGKWRELSSGGGSGGTTYTAGDGIDISDDTISIDSMPAEDMDEVVTPVPGVVPRDGIKYSTTEQIIGEWVDGKPLYQKTYITSTPSSSDVVTDLFSVSDLNIDTPVKMRAFTLGTWNDINYCQEIPYAEDSNPNSYVYVGGGSAESHYLLFTSEHNIVCKCGISRINVPLYITLQYTKTTD